MRVLLQMSVLCWTKAGVGTAADVCVGQRLVWVLLQMSVLCWTKAGTSTAADVCSVLDKGWCGYCCRCLRWTKAGVGTAADVCVGQRLVWVLLMSVLCWTKAGTTDQSQAQHLFV